MGLLELLTNDASFTYYSGGTGNFVQKSIPYGNDQPGGRSSKQPYIKNNILDPKEFVKSPDNGLIRGGIIGNINANRNDGLRISRFFLDSPQGPLFIAKQVGLQLSNPRIEWKKYGLLKRGLGNTFFGKIVNFGIDIINAVTPLLPGPTRTYNLGINTLKSVSNAGMGEHLDRHGLTARQDSNTKYFNVVRNNDIEQFNRLVSLKERLIGQPNEQIIDQYMGGPDSVYGIGSTVIHRRGPNLILNQDTTSNRYATHDSFLKPFNTKFNIFDLTRQFNGPSRRAEDKKGDKIKGIQFQNILVANGPSKGYGLDEATLGIDKDNNIISKPNFTLQNVIEGNAVSPAFRTYDAIKNELEFRQKVYNLGFVKTENGYESNDDTPLYYNSGYGQKITLQRGLKEYARERRVGSGRKDTINLTPLFDMQGLPGNKVLVKMTDGSSQEKKVRDLIKFRIGAIDNDFPDVTTWMAFRAYLKGISDSYSQELNDTKYVGRGDKFHIYSGTDRKMAFTFRVAALSREEMKPMYQRLNFLASCMYPDYSANGMMRGNLMKVTIGDYLNAQPGFITSLTYTVVEDASWEIAIDQPEGGALIYDLPHIIDVTCNFTPLGAGPLAELPRKSASVPLIMYSTHDNNPWTKDSKGALLLPLKATQK